MVNGRAYTVACDDGEEDHLRELATHVDSKVRELLESVGQVGDARLMLMAALLITDDLLDARANLNAQSSQADELAVARESMSSIQLTSAAAIEAAATRAEEIVAKLARA